MKSLVLTVSLVLMHYATGCSGKDAEPAVTAADLKEKIEAGINSNSQLSSANLSISADPERNTATISGTVESQELRMTALDLAKSAHAGLLVEDNMTVQPRELSRAEFTQEHAREERERAKTHKDRIGDSTNDAWIHATIVVRLIPDPNAQERRINVDVNNGVVTLRGTVDNADQKAEAERISRQVEGVRRVNNVLQVSELPDRGIEMRSVEI